MSGVALLVLAQNSISRFLLSSTATMQALFQPYRPSAFLQNQEYRVDEVLIS